MDLLVPFASQGCLEPNSAEGRLLAAARALSVRVTCGDRAAGRRDACTAGDADPGTSDGPRPLR